MSARFQTEIDIDYSEQEINALSDSLAAEEYPLMKMNVLRHTHPAILVAYLKSTGE